MVCEHKNVTSSSKIQDINTFNELFTITCTECNSIIHKDLMYDEFIDICKKNEYIVILDNYDC